MIPAYPLHWPTEFPRVKQRQEGAFKTSLAAALKNVEDSLRLFSKDSARKIEGLVISSNCSLGQQRPADPGVAVWFTWDGLQVCIPVDRYTKVEANLQAIHHVIEARRTELRHGGISIVRATFMGFKALPAPDSSAPRVRRPGIRRRRQLPPCTRRCAPGRTGNRRGSRIAACIRRRSNSTC